MRQTLDARGGRRQRKICGGWHNRGAKIVLRTNHREVATVAFWDMVQTASAICELRSKVVLAIVTVGPSPHGLAEVVRIARDNVKSAKLAKADIVGGRYSLTFHGPREKALDEMEVALNAFRFDTSDATGIELQFESGPATSKSD